MSRKKLAVTLSPIPVVVWLMLFQTPVFAAFAVTEVWSAPSAEYWPSALGSILLNCIANVLFVISVSLAPLSLAVPILSLTPVFSALGAFLLLNEPTTLRQAIGIAIIVASTFALGRGGVKTKTSENSEDEVTDPAQARRGMTLMGIVALLWATTPVLDKIGLREVPSSQHAFMQCLGVAAILSVWLLVKRRGFEFARVRGSFIWFSIAVFAAAAALGFQLWSIQYVPVGIFEALKRSVGLLAALSFGYIFFKEPITRQKTFIVAVMGVGIFILLA